MGFDIKVYWDFNKNNKWTEFSEYKVDKHIYKGPFSDTFIVTKNGQKEKFCLKRVNKEGLNLRKFLQEIFVLKYLEKKGVKDQSIV